MYCCPQILILLHSTPFTIHDDRTPSTKEPTRKERFLSLEERKITFIIFLVVAYQKKKKNRLNSKELFYSKYYLYQNWNFEHLLINNKTMAAFIFFFFLILFFSHKPWNHGLLFLFFSFLIFFNIFSVWWGWK
jgi:hypothetical protein